MVRLTIFRTGSIASLVLLVVSTIGCGNRSELESQSNENMEKLAAAVWEYRDADGVYPENLDDSTYQEDVGGPEVFQYLMKNPLTGDDPGYEYVKPPDDTPLSASDVIIIYQLRDGHRDTTLPSCTLGGTAQLQEP